jgi:hypothetical protein
LHLLLAEPVTIKRLIPPFSQGRYASFCLSWTTDAYDPGVSSPAQPVGGKRKDPHPAMATHSGIDLNFSNFRPLRAIRHSIADLVIDLPTNGVFQLWITRQPADR